MNTAKRKPSPSAMKRSSNDEVTRLEGSVEALSALSARYLDRIESMVEEAAKALEALEVVDDDAVRKHLNNIQFNL